MAGGEAGDAQLVFALPVVPLVLPRLLGVVGRHVPPHARVAAEQPGRGHAIRTPVPQRLIMFVRTIDAQDYFH